MRAWPLAILLLAGCFGGDSGGSDGGDGTPGPGDGGNGTAPPPPPPPAGPPPVLDLLLSFRFEGCEGLTILRDTPAADVQALLPEGFAPSPNPVTQQAGSAVLAIDLFQCDALATPSANVTDTAYGQLYTFI